MKVKKWKLAVFLLPCLLLFALIYLTTNGGPGETTLNLPLYLYKTSMTDNNYGYANMMGVVLILAGILTVYAINRLFRMNEADY